VDFDKRYHKRYSDDETFIAKHCITLCFAKNKAVVPENVHGGIYSAGGMLKATYGGAKRVGKNCSSRYGGGRAIGRSCSRRTRTDGWSGVGMP